MSGKSVSKVDNTVRKSWDKATYESIAKEREAKVCAVLGNSREKGGGSGAVHECYRPAANVHP